MELVRLAFQEGVVPRSFGVGTLVMIPKAEPGQFRPINLLCVVYKLVASVINGRLMAAIKFDDALHGNMKGRGTGTAIMELKLHQQLRMKKDEPLYMVFLDLKKAYYSLNRERALEILRRYGVGRNILRILSTVWESDTLAPRRAGYFGKSFRPQRGVRAGDTVSPTIFNICVDAVVRHWRQHFQPTELEEFALFYVDDGLLAGPDKERVQEGMNRVAAAFEKLGLEMNASKTKYMVMRGGTLYRRERSEVYWRRCTGEGKSYDERMKEKVKCVKCGAEVVRPSLKRHQRSAYCKRARRTYRASPPTLERVATEEAETPAEEAALFEISIPAGWDEDVECPVPGCPYCIMSHQVNKRGLMRRHFRAKHWDDTIVVEEEGELPQCRRCGIFMKDANGEKHFSSVDCHYWSDRKVRREKAQKQNTVVPRTRFFVGEVELERVERFKYLGRIVDEDDDDFHAVDNQLAKARLKWGRFGRVLRTTGAPWSVLGYFYKAVVQAVHLRGAK